MKRTTMKTIKKIDAGMKGTKKLVEEYGDKLICVRYRNDCERKRKVKTIEIIIDESPLSDNSSKIPLNKIIYSFELVRNRSLIEHRKSYKNLFI